MATSERRRAELDWMEPSQAYRRLRAGGERPFLMDGMGAHPEARYAYVAVSPAWEARIDDGVLRIDGEAQRGAALDGLRALCDGMRRDVHEPEGFTGGIVGMVGYEVASLFEPTLPRHVVSTPDALFWLMRDVVVFDRRTRRAWLWCNDLPGEVDSAGRESRHMEALRPSDASAGPGSRPTDAPEPAARHGPAAPADDPSPPDGSSGRWRTSLDAAGFEAAVERLRRHIHAGDLFQANIATRWSTPCTEDPADLFDALAAANPSPFMALYEADDHALVSCSPEQLFGVREGVLRARPIAGTRPRGATPDEDAANEAELLADAKEQSEHTMLVDLLRNDIAKVSVPGSVQVPERMSVERYRHVMHLVSRVEGRLRSETGFVDWLAALFPGGTITGAPKHRACLRIHEAEPVGRGPYTGSAGYLSWSHNAQWNILIRTLVLQDGEAHVHAGSGIVADSDPAREWQEAGHKAQALLDAATGATTPRPSDRLGEVVAHGAWRHPEPRQVGGRVLLIDNYDSFTHNLAEYAAACGAQVRVVRNDAPWQADAAWASHIIISPGPGRPEESGASLEVLQAPSDKPVLGVCLGHQAMALATGVPVDVVAPVHGKPARIDHAGTGLLAGLASPLSVGRYHSLAVTTAAAEAAGWQVDAWWDDLVMAMRHPGRPWTGLQFHPESLCTDAGLEIIARFLEAD